MENAVGPVLMICGGRVDLVVSAIRDDNPEIALQVVEGDRQVRVLAPYFLRVTRMSLQWHLGPRFELDSLESMIVTSAGCMRRTSEEITWEAGSSSRAELTAPTSGNGLAP
ncbi:MmoB/DmpM family protein [Pseudonocardia bannensis]|uniref:Monooxygenase n=1 Tax=Pseudonocardia bannensis TaxID=630973 RepID=A0A848DJD9_9PSEU|nr:monooxygenase [Pseudonocardia bannensis]